MEAGKVYAAVSTSRGIGDITPESQVCTQRVPTQAAGLACVSVSNVFYSTIWTTSTRCTNSRRLHLSVAGWSTNAWLGYLLSAIFYKPLRISRSNRNTSSENVRLTRNRTPVGVQEAAAGVPAKARGRSPGRGERGHDHRGVVTFSPVGEDTRVGHPVSQPAVRASFWRSNNAEFSLHRPPRSCKRPIRGESGPATTAIHTDPRSTAGMAQNTICNSFRTARISCLRTLFASFRWRRELGRRWWRTARRSFRATSSGRGESLRPRKTTSCGESTVACIGSRCWARIDSVRADNPGRKYACPNDTLKFVYVVGVEQDSFGLCDKE